MGNETTLHPSMARHEKSSFTGRRSRGSGLIGGGVPHHDRSTTLHPTLRCCGASSSGCSNGRPARKAFVRERPGQREANPKSLEGLWKPAL